MSHIIGQPDVGGWFWYRNWPQSDVWRIGLVFDDGCRMYRVGAAIPCSTKIYSQYMPIRDANDEGTESAGTWTAEELRLHFARRREAKDAGALT